MSDRNRKNVKSIIELIGAVAVLIGLVFVGLELRQNTVAVQAATFQGMTDTSSNFLLTVALASYAKRIQTMADGNLERR